MERSCHPRLYSVGMTSDTRKRKEIHSQAREMIAKVYHFLREEYDFLRQNNFDNCDLTPLANVRKRTAEATGVSERTVTQVLKEERELAALDATSVKRLKKDKNQSAKKKLRNSGERNIDEGYEKTSIHFWTIKSSKISLIPAISFLEPLPANLIYDRTLLNSVAFWMTYLKSVASKYLAPMKSRIFLYDTVENMGVYDFVFTLLKNV